MPTFAVGAAAQYSNADEGWGIPTLPPFRGEPELSWHLINELVEKEFDVVTCQEMLVDHACTLPLKLFWPEGDCPVTVVPVCINTVQFPLPSARRCYALGKAVGEAIQSWDSSKKVAVIASGGLSHQLDGERAGFINKAFDLQFLDLLSAGRQTHLRVISRSREGQGWRGTSKSMRRSVCSSHSRISCLARRWLSIACCRSSACAGVTMRCTSLPPIMCPHS
jgi:hypothetical protein